MVRVILSRLTIISPRQVSILTLAWMLRPTSGSTKQHDTVSQLLSRLQDTGPLRAGRLGTNEQAVKYKDIQSKLP